MKEFSNFKDLKNHFKHKEIDAEKKEKEERLEKFNKLLKDKMHKLGGSFPSIIHGVDYINIVSNPSKETNIADVLYSNVYYKNNEKKQHYKTFTLFNDGIMQDEKIPDVLKIKNKYEIYDELLRLADTINLGLYKNVNDELLPPETIITTIRGIKKLPGEHIDTDIDIFRGGKDIEDIRDIEEEYHIDPRRLEFFKKQPYLITGFSGINSAFSGYYGHIFPKFLVLENEKVGNGAFFKDFEEPIEIDNRRFKLPPDQRITQSEFDDLMMTRWAPLAGLTKSEFVLLGGNRKIHPDKHDPEWERKMQLEIDKRS